MGGFVRSFDAEQIENLSASDREFFARLKADTHSGAVFPAVRKRELHFYHSGGCLYKIIGNKLKRHQNYDKLEYSADTQCLDDYEKAKKQNQNRFAKADNTSTERQLLDKLNCHTFCQKFKSKVVVLDIEVRLNGQIGGSKKCDMVLLNTKTNEIMFVEGKVFWNRHVNTAVGSMPEVIKQVGTYTEGIGEQYDNIINQYGEHIKIINGIFSTAYNPQIRLINTAKLLVYQTPLNPTQNGKYTMDKINTKLGAANVLWAFEPPPTIDDIWDALCR